MSGFCVSWGPGNCFARLRVYVFVGGFFFVFVYVTADGSGGLGGQCGCRKPSRPF